MIEEYYVKRTSKNGRVTYKPVDITKMAICGKTIEEIIDILNALNVERIYNIEMTMNNLKQYIKIYQKEQKEMLKEYWNKQIKELKEMKN